MSTQTQERAIDRQFYEYFPVPFFRLRGGDDELIFLMEEWKLRTGRYCPQSVNNDQGKKITVASAHCFLLGMTSAKES